MSLTYGSRVSFPLLSLPTSIACVLRPLSAHFISKREKERFIWKNLVLFGSWGDLKRWKFSSLSRGRDVDDLFSLLSSYVICYTWELFCISSLSLMQLMTMIPPTCDSLPSSWSPHLPANEATSHWEKVPFLLFIIRDHHHSILRLNGSFSCIFDCQ